MAFSLIKELLELQRDQGSKRLLLGLYQAGDTEDSVRYLALSEQEKRSTDGPWVGTRKGITVRRSEVQAVITAFQAADLDAKPDNKGLSHQEYAEQVLDEMLGLNSNRSQE